MTPDTVGALRGAISGESLHFFFLLFCSFFFSERCWVEIDEGRGVCTARGFCGRCQMPCDGRRVGGDWGDGSGEERFWRFFISRGADGELVCDFDDGFTCA